MRIKMYVKLYHLPSRRKVQFTILVSALSQLESMLTIAFQGDAIYTKDISHFANSSTQQSMCTVEPGTARDVGKIVSQIIIFIDYRSDALSII